MTFDPREVIERVESFAPGTLIAVEEIGRGFRLNEHFPEGDLTGRTVRFEGATTLRTATDPILVMPTLLEIAP